MEKLLLKHILDQAELGVNFETMLRNGYLTADDVVLRDQRASVPAIASGCTALTAIIVEKEVFVANIGDTEGVVGTLSSGSWTYTLLSEKHAPKSNSEERARIVEMGGAVPYGKVFGSLGVSRAFGDPGYKVEKLFVTPEPYIRRHKLAKHDKFLVLACDGLWDVLSYHDVVEFVGERMQQNRPLQRIAEKLVRNALSQGSQDNITVVLVQLLH
jgi:serine/threonine protein phosphatase PrpC